MPTYVYACPVEGCDHTLELYHSIAECDSPTVTTVVDITCPYHLERMIRVIQEVQLLGSRGGKFLSGHEKSVSVQQERKKRSRAHFKREILETLPEQDKQMHEKRLGLRREETWKKKKRKKIFGGIKGD